MGLVCALGIGVSPAAATDVAPGNGEADVSRAGSELARLCEYGITLALGGQGGAAESVFVGLLSRAPHDARALNNLGNLRLLRGDTDVALAFYAQAGKADSADAGIMLNEATACMIAGDDEAAGARADEAVAGAGGPERAARLLGLQYTRPEDEDALRGSDRVSVTRDEALALLRAAARAVPADTTSGPAAKAEGAAAHRRKPLPPWRSAGARAGSDTGAAVYWKR
jgi:Flp pilus assembly protein TadD